MTKRTGTYHNYEYLASVITLSVVLVFQKAPDLILKPGIVGVNDTPESLFGTTAFADSFHDLANSAEAISILDILHRGERLRVSKRRLAAGESCKAAFQSVEGYLVTVLKQLGKPLADAAQRAWLDSLGYTLVQPLRTAPMRQLIDEGMG